MSVIHHSKKDWKRTYMEELQKNKELETATLRNFSTLPSRWTTNDRKQIYAENSAQQITNSREMGGFPEPSVVNLPGWVQQG